MKKILSLVAIVMFTVIGLCGCSSDKVKLTWSKTYTELENLFNDQSINELFREDKKINYKNADLSDEIYNGSSEFNDLQIYESIIKNNTMIMQKYYSELAHTPEIEKDKLNKISSEFMRFKNSLEAYKKESKNFIEKKDDFNNFYKQTVNVNKIVELDTLRRFKEDFEKYTLKTIEVSNKFYEIFKKAYSEELNKSIVKNKNYLDYVGQTMEIYSIFNQDFEIMFEKNSSLSDIENHLGYFNGIKLSIVVDSEKAKSYLSSNDLSDLENLVVNYGNYKTEFIIQRDITKIHFNERKTDAEIDKLFGVDKSNAILINNLLIDYYDEYLPTVVSKFSAVNNLFV